MIGEMFEKMYEAKGIGLAANQVDLPYRVFVLNLTGDAEEKDQEMVFINPVLSNLKGSTEGEEGCLSFPGLYANVRRAEKVTVRAFDLSGNDMEYQATGLFARAAQHENDHLDGVLFTDRLATSGELTVREWLDQMEHEFADAQSRGEAPSNDAILKRLAELEALRT